MSDTLTSKNKRQDEGIERWRKTGGIGGLLWPTGMGKTYCGVNKVIKPLKTARVFSDILILVHTTALKDSWEASIKEYLEPEQQEDITVKTIQSMTKNNTVAKCTLLIIDEIDEFYSEERKKYWTGERVQYKFFLWLTATHEDAINRHKDLLAIAPIRDQITIDEAERKGWIEKPIVFNLGVRMTEEEQEQYAELSDTISDCLSRFDDDFSKLHSVVGKDAYSNALAIAEANGWSKHIGAITSKPKPLALNQEEWERLLVLNANWNPNHLIGFARKAFSAIHARKVLLSSCESKVAVSAEIAKRFGTNHKMMYFGEFTETASKIYNAIKDLGLKVVEYHSQVASRPLRADFNDKPHLLDAGEWITIKTKKSPNYGKKKIFGKQTLLKLAIDHIIKGVVNIIVTGVALNKGFDVRDMQIGVITSFRSATANDYIQRIGRITRVHELKKDKKPIIVIIYVKDSKESYDLQQIQSRDVYWIELVDEISWNPDESTNINIGI